jgi:hypothetical protein
MKNKYAFISRGQISDHTGKNDERKKTNREQHIGNRWVFVSA